MKKLLSLLTAALLILSMLTLSACSGSKARVESIFEINPDFSGHRSITVKFPLDTQIETLKDKLIKNNPFKDSNKSKFEYLGVEKDGYSFVMNIGFSSHNDYVAQASQLVGHDVTVYMTQCNTVLTTGTRMTEDFDVSELISWITRLSEEDQSTRGIEYEYSVNTVKLGSDVFNTSSTVDISQREGKPINSISIETTNLKDGTYDRTITFYVPNKTYNELTGSISEYFAANTSPEAQYCGWTSQGSVWKYQVIYKALDIERLSQYTSMLLDSDSVSIIYSDRDNSGTPLSEGLTFEENLDTFSFMSEDGGNVPLEYKYALPTQTTHSDAVLLNSGKWVVEGSWKEGVYNLSLDSDHMNIRIPDGIQYAINGIRFNLDVVGENDFVRTTEFLYSKTQGIDGMNYAKQFFESKGADVECTEDSDNLICKVTCKGTATEITDSLVKYFGSGNFMAYSIKDKALSLSAKTKMTDYINLGNMLNSTNANRPMTYSVKSGSNENIVSLMCDGSEATYKKDDNKHLSVDIVAGVGTVIYEGNIPDTGAIILYSIVSLVLVCGTVAIIILMLSKRSKRSRKSLLQNDGTEADMNDDKGADTSAPSQTTTFSITELNALSDRLNKKYRDQIDKDISEKIEADRLENLKKELKAKEIEQLHNMVYNTKTDKDEENDKASDSDVSDDA